MTDIPHDVEAFLISSVRTIEIFSSQDKHYISTLIASPILAVIDDRIDVLTFQIFLQSNRIVVITPAEFCFAFCSRAFNYPYLTSICYSFRLRCHLRPVVSSYQFLLNVFFQVFLQIFLHFFHILLLKFYEFFLFLKLFSNIFFLVFKFLIHISASDRNNLSQKSL